MSRIHAPRGHRGLATVLAPAFTVLGSSDAAELLSGPTLADPSRRWVF